MENDILKQAALILGKN